MGNYLIDNWFKKNHTLAEYEECVIQPSFVTEINSGKIQICPKNFILMKDDVSFSSIGEDSYQEFFDQIPKINIREYIMDLPEDRWLDILLQTYTDMKDVFEELKKKDAEEIKKQWQKFTKNFSTQEFITKFGENGGILNSEDTQMQLAYDIPAFVYRKLMSFDITGYYELPYSGKIGFNGNGNSGWHQGKLFQGEFKFLSDININRVPMWKYEGQDGDTIQFELNLFNDTYDAAVQNFRFIHTMIPRNMWLQHGLFQHNPNTYDIQFDGGLRYFCCSLDVNVEFVGNSRLPKDADAFMKDVNSNPEAYEANKKIDVDILRIPDVFKVTFQFKSLLPNNFNQYMMTYNEQDYITNGPSRQETYAKDMAGAMADTIKELWNSSGEKKETQTQNGTFGVDTSATAKKYTAIADSYSFEIPNIGT